MSLETHRPTLMKVLDKRDADKILNDEQIKEYMEQGFLCIMQTMIHLDTSQILTSELNQVLDKSSLIFTLFLDTTWRTVYKKL